MYLAFTKGPNKVFWWVVVTSILASIASFAYYYSQGRTIDYVDSMSHLLIAKRVIDGNPSGMGQIGHLWLPLPHLLIVLLVKNGFLYRTGIAGSILSMVCFVVTAVYVYKTALRLQVKRDVWAAVIAVVVIITNFNMLYMQSTPMTELPLFVFLAAGAYYLVRWSQMPVRSSSEPFALFLLGFSVACAALTRYEGWAYAITVAIAIVYIGFRKGLKGKEIQDRVVYYGFCPGAIILLWIGWNALIFHNPFYFIMSDYAKSSNWVQSDDKVIGNMMVSFQTYGLATLHNLSVPVAFLSLTGFVYFLVRSRLRPEMAGVLVLMFPFPFFLVMLYYGARPLDVEEVSGIVINARFGLIMILPAALMVGYFVQNSKWRKVLVLPVIAWGVVSFFPNDIITLEEPIGYTSSPGTRLQRDAATWLNANYVDGQPMLMEAYRNETAHFYSVSPSNVIYEGSQDLWENAIKNPASYVDWVYTQCGGEAKDVVCKKLVGTSQLDSFDLVYQNPEVMIFRKKE